MTKNISNNLIFLGIAFVFIFTSCNNEDICFPDNKVGLTRINIIGAIKNNENANTRISTLKDDRWTARDFSNGDELGYYSSEGDPENNGPIINLELKYSKKEGNGSIFLPANDGFLLDMGKLNASNVFMYCPYTQNMPSLYSQNETAIGLELRQKIESEGKEQYRCVDFLTADGVDTEKIKDGIIYGSFYHTFSELIIMRGEGFDKPRLPDGMSDSDDDPHRITIVMKDGYTHVSINLGNATWSITPKLNDMPSSNINSKRWDAWKGEAYNIEGGEAQEAWYVVLPTLGNSTAPDVMPKDYGQPTEVDYIELYDNEGKLQKVTSLSLSNGTRYIDSGWRYPLTVMMQDLVPTVYPHTIIPWNKDVNITDIRDYGINNDNFPKWLIDYAHYLKDNEKDLSAYGDYIENQKIWQFYLLEDIDLTTLANAYSDLFNQFSQRGYIIEHLKDIINGKKGNVQGSRGDNYRIKGLKTTFINRMSDNGQLIDIDFVDPVVIKTTSEATGVIANSIQYPASIYNCTITSGTLRGDGPVGLVAGKVINGVSNTVTKCYLSGNISGSSTTSSKLFGELDGTSFTPTGNETFILFSSSEIN